MIRTSSWNAWSTLIRNFALHSMYGIPTEQLNCCASSNDTYFWKRQKMRCIFEWILILNLIILPVGGRINPIYCRLRALETHLGLWHAEFVSEIYWFQQNCCGPLTNIQAEILHPIACIAHLYKNSVWLNQFKNSPNKIRINFKIFGIKQKNMIQAKIWGLLTHALHWIPLDRLFW